MKTQGNVFFSMTMFHFHVAVQFSERFFPDMKTNCKGAHERANTLCSATLVELIALYDSGDTAPTQESLTNRKRIPDTERVSSRSPFPRALRDKPDSLKNKI